MSITDPVPSQGPESASWDEEVDLLIVGGGAAGMTRSIAAHDAGLSALVVEKADVFGGSTALSGSGVRIPDDPVLRSLGRSDSRKGCAVT
ncbi:FAD-binding protein [Streptomyces sp. NPDC055681]